MKTRFGNTRLATLAGTALLATVVGAGTASAAQLESWDDKQLMEFFCENGGSHHSRQFYADWEKGEAMLPYKLKRNTTLGAEARGALYDQPQLNGDTAGAMCAGPTEYARVLKNITLDLKSDLKDECATEDGMRKFFERKAAVLTEACLKEIEREKADTTD